MGCSLTQKPKDSKPAVEINVSRCVLVPAFPLFAILVVCSLYSPQSFFIFSPASLADFITCLGRAGEELFLGISGRV